MAQFLVYVDESGDEGFLFRAGSSEWFVLSAAIIRAAIEPATVAVVDQVRGLFKKPAGKPLHFRELKHDHRVAYAAALAGADLRITSLLIHKPSLNEPEKFSERYRLYFYAVRYLLERVSWYCRDHRSLQGDCSAEVIFSNRASMSYAELCNYLKLLKANSGIWDVSIEWSCIDPSRVRALPVRSRKGLEIADAAAGSFFKAVEQGTYGYTEDRYARTLKPVVYSYRGRYFGYGVKVWPKEVSSGVASRPELSWVRDTFQP